jgi:predicted nucleotidyltransferase
MNGHHGVPAATWACVALVMRRFPTVEKAVLFGSRAKGTHKNGSDIDLALVGTDLRWRTVGQIYDELDDLLLPYRFSLVVWDSETDAEVASHIERVGTVVYVREQQMAPR